ncbi:putative bifunctional diguanylate cyclase/phosphodiesterase [Castellaniella caeni]|uniref:putative bifunctional diguanylate cyclase/phosphodiesterase n=1 Tax=Castellaniella caeni TaxID=266123 RepID=UPI0009FD313F|nr:bifunctional diguanylate cyclase/phosphodiesterase [Castellaniella caeni]
MHPIASYDPVTELPQRQMFIKYIDQTLVDLVRKKKVLGAVLVLDIDGFRKINETYGLDAGDLILHEIGRRLTGAIQPCDMVSHTNGDEFMVLLALLGTDRLAAASSALKTAEKLHSILTEEPFQTGEVSLFIQVSIGLTILDEHSAKISQVLQEAGMALHMAEEKGGNCIVFFNSRIQTRITERLSLERDLAAALKASQLHMVLQPQYGQHGQVTGAELLARWTHPVRGSISPAQFIPIAAEAGLMRQLTCWSLRVACKTLVALQQRGVNHPLSVNISPQSLLQPDFVAAVKTILDKTGAPASRLIFEITEEAWLDDLEIAAQHMRELNQLGIRFSIDDFGAGFTNLTYLRRLPIDELKIDKSQVQDLPENMDSQAIIQMILGMARQLGLRVVAEGIEMATQAEFLFQHGCDALQGFWMARPMPIETWMEQQAK